MDISKEIGNIPSTRYQGSKRKILPWIYDCIKDVGFNTVLDAFGGSGIGGRTSMSDLLLSGKKQRDCDFLSLCTLHYSRPFTGGTLNLWRRENEPKETFPQPRPSPEGRMQKENCRNRQFSLGFGKPGRRDEFFIGLARRDVDEGINLESY